MKNLIVLAGGFGSRLKTAVSDVPKPLAPIGDKTFLEYLINNWTKVGIKDITFLLHYESEKIIELLKSLSEKSFYKNVSFSFLVEDIPLGTGGSILNAIKVLNIKESFFVANADTWLSNGIQNLIQSDPISIGAIKVDQVDRYGSLDISNNKITSFIEKSNIGSSGWINAGIYHLSPEIFSKKNYQESFSLEEVIFSELSLQNKLNACCLDGNFIDIGIPEDYYKFCEWVKKGKINELT